MRFLTLLCCLACINFAFPAQAIKYHVSNSISNKFGGGDDTYSAIQAQNPLTPWRTIDKAIRSVAPGDEIVINSGDYAESTNNTGVLIFNRDFRSNPITLRSWSLNPNDVTIRGRGGIQNYSLRFFALNAGGVILQSVTLTTTQGATPLQRTVIATEGYFNGLQLTDCIIRPSAEPGDAFGILLSNGSADISNFLIEDTTIDMTPRSPAARTAGIYMMAASARGKASNITVRNCRVRAYTGIVLEGVPGAVVEDCDIACVHPVGIPVAAYLPALAVGADMTSLAPADDAYPGCAVRRNRILLTNPNSRLLHGVVSGKGAINAEWTENYIHTRGATFSWVIKGTGVQLRDNLLIAAANGAELTVNERPYGLLLKGALNLVSQEDVFIAVGQAFAMRATPNLTDLAPYRNREPTATFTGTYFLGGKDGCPISWQGGSANFSGCIFQGSRFDPAGYAPDDMALGLTTGASSAISALLHLTQPFPLTILSDTDWLSMRDADKRRSNIRSAILRSLQ